jgi:hypothetical protein
MRVAVEAVQLTLARLALVALVAAALVQIQIQPQHQVLLI